MNHLTQVVTISVIDIETQKEVERRIIESPSVFNQEIETNRLPSTYGSKKSLFFPMNLNGQVIR